MKLDLKTFKKIHEDGDKAVLRHSDGHEIHISKDKLPMEQQKQLQMLPFHSKPKKMAEGGEVEAQDSQSREEWKGRWDKMAKGARKEFADGGAVSAIDQFMDSNPQSAVNSSQSPLMPPEQAPNLSLIDAAAEAHGQDPAIVSGAEDAPSTQSNDMSVGAGPAPASLAPPAAVETKDPLLAGAEQSQDALMHGISQQESGIRQEAAATGALGKEQAVMQDKLGNDKQSQLDSYQTHVSQLDDERQKFIHDVQNNLVDPNRFLNSRSTGQKVLTTIGLLLGGLAGGSPAPALKIIQDQIDNDIKGQEDNLGARKSLLEANMRQYGNLKDAVDMTRVMMTDTAAAHLEAAASRAKDPIAKARALQALGELQQKNAPIIQQMAVRRAALAGAAGGQDPSRLVPVLVPEGERGKVFEEVKHAQDIRKAKGAIIDAFDKASTQFKGAPGDRSGVKALHALISANLGHVEGSVREAAMKAADENLTPQFGDSQATIRSKRKSLENWLESGASAPTAKGYGIDLDKFQSTQHAPSADTRTMNGVPYRKVGNNWVRVK